MSNAAAQVMEVEVTAIAQAAAEAVTKTEEVTEAAPAAPAVSAETHASLAGLVEAVKLLKDIGNGPASNDEPEQPADLEPYIFDFGKSKMIYLPFDVRHRMYQDDEVDRLIDSRTLYGDEGSIKDPAQLKIQQRRASIQASEMYVKREAVENFLVGLDLSDEREAKVFNKLKPIFEQVKAHFDAILKNFLDSAEGQITYDELLIGMNTVGMLFSFNDGEATTYFTTKKAETINSMFGSYLKLTGEVHVNYGKGVQKTETSFKLPTFGGTMSLAELGLTCLEKNEEAIKKLVKRGKKYVAITSAPAYMRCEGTLLRRGYWNSTSYKAKGRVMVDYTAMKSMDPNYNLYFGLDRYRDDDQKISGKKDVNEVLPDIVYATCSPFVYGFSFISKQWGEMQLDELSDIQFREDAFDMLVMDQGRKSMIRALVETTYTGKKDVIDGKGGGCIFLLAGTPGVGKTLTAETVAEQLKRPLYMVGVGELGTSVRSLEENLRNILEIATTWNAVLLIDEADIFMEERSEMDVERNAMVGIFLRLLEYYEGVLFLTTNRAKNIDQAFFSRISMSIYYKPLENSDRLKIWTNLVKLYDIGISRNELDQLSQAELNGRQIKNTVRLSKALAMKDKRNVSYADIRNVMSKGVEFNNEMRGGYISRAWKYVKNLFA